MVAIEWDQGELLEPIGLDRGVLYLPNRPGIAWNGLISIKEVSVDSDPEHLYFDGKKVTTVKSPGDHTLELTAFTYPEEFDPYIGNSDILDNQPRVETPFVIIDHGDGSWTAVGSDDYITMDSSTEFTIDSPTATTIDSESYSLGTQYLDEHFGFSYRTGDSENGLLHIVYNAKASHSDILRSSLSNDPDLEPFVFDISTKPVVFEEIRPTAHVIVDLVKTPNHILSPLLEVLYGTATTDPQLPSLEDVFAIYEEYAILVVVDHKDGTWSVDVPDSTITWFSATEFEIDWPVDVVVSDDTYTIETIY